MSVIEHVLGRVAGRVAGARSRTCSEFARVQTYSRAASPTDTVPSLRYPRDPAREERRIVAAHRAWRPYISAQTSHGAAQRRAAQVFVELHRIRGAWPWVRWLGWTFTPDGLWMLQVQDISAARAVCKIREALTEHYLEQGVP